MFKILNSKIHLALFRLPSTAKVAGLVILDSISLIVSLWLASALRLSEFWPERFLEANLSVFISLPVISVLVFKRFGLYKVRVRYLSAQTFRLIVVGVVSAGIVVYSLALLLGSDFFPRSVPIIFCLCAVSLLCLIRHCIVAYHNWSLSKTSIGKPLVIFGANDQGVRLANFLLGDSKFRVVALVDDDVAGERPRVGKFIVHPVSEFESLIERFGVSVVLLSVPSIGDLYRPLLVKLVAKYQLEVRVFPSAQSLIEGQPLGNLETIKIEDFLGRDKVDPMPNLMKGCVLDKVVLITGGGGSIGSEIARQVVAYGARHVILLDHSEYAVYSIDQELQKVAGQKNTIITPLIGSVVNRSLIRSVLKRFKIDTIYHAAAYKHVPLVEHNIIDGLLNNVVGTEIVATEAAKAKVANFVLISTDKAVRPTSIMGATKRVSEIVIHNLSKKFKKTIFSGVRFGNVLGSSGSVIPVFKKQIEEGGPVKVTHADVERYFMTTSEAASLVIQAASMAKSGDIFVLDMGGPIKILDLAKSMISLSGKTLKDRTHPEGDIELVLTGLRPGEKLYEELFIDGTASPTKHPKIMLAEESYPSSVAIISGLRGIKSAIKTRDAATARHILEILVSEFKPSSS
ncbi:MAG: nucleoside-diphosphate sugar epimerase/dehydratase [Flavobacteriaceae bacterium]